MREKEKVNPAADALEKWLQPVMVKPDPLKLEWVPRAGGAAPTYGWGRWCRRGDGRYVFVPLAGRWTQLTPESMKAMGFAMTFREFMRTLRSLARAGMINMTAVSPRVALVDVESLFAHIEKGSRNIDRFETGTPERRAFKFGNGERVSSNDAKKHEQENKK